MIRTVHATHYVTPLREGGSLPAIVEGDDDGTWVAKFRGAGQGIRALIAELVSGELARHLGLPVPEIVFIEMDGRLAKTEPDPEIQDLLRKSEGVNLALDYLPGSIGFDPLIGRPFDSMKRLASSIVWFDALVTNVDRTARNPNLLVWHGKPYLIDHGASLFFHHDWRHAADRSRSRFPEIRDHVLLPWAEAIAEVDAEMSAALTVETLERILGFIPDDWLGDVEGLPTAAAHREGYLDWFRVRLEGPREWVEEAIDARSLLV